MGAPNAGMAIEGSATHTLKLAVLYGVPMLVAALAIGAALDQPLPIPQGEPTMHVDPSVAGLHDFDRRDLLRPDLFVEFSNRQVMQTFMHAQTRRARVE